MRFSCVLLLALCICWAFPAAQAQTGMVQGVVLADGNPLGNVTVDVRLPGFFETTTTATDGTYSFNDVPTGDVRVWIIVPLGFYAVSPNSVIVNLSSGQIATVNFELGLVPHAGAARGLGYWKHQASALVHGLPNPQESLYQLGQYRDRLVVFDSSYREGPIDFCSFYDWVQCPWGSSDGGTLFYTALVEAPQGPSNLVKGKVQLLVLFLNVVSYRLQTLDVISADGATVSQAIQQISTQLLDDDLVNDESAKDLAERINSGRQVAAGVIDISLPVVVYSGPYGWWAPRPTPAVGPLRVTPNPMVKSSTLEFVVNSPGDALVQVYDVAGRLVRTLLDEEMPIGRHNAVWDGRSDSGQAVANGVYFYRISAPDGVMLARFVVMQPR